MTLIIAGHQRSGTTLLLRLCNTHPDITLTMEFGNFLCLGKSWEAYMGRIFKRWVGIGLTRRRVPVILPIDFKTWMARTERKRSRKYIVPNHLFIMRYLFKMFMYWREYVDSKVIEVILQNMFPGSSIVGDKFPDYIFELENLVKDKRMSILVIYRDCRDVAASTLEKTHGPWRNMPFFIKKLNTAEKIAKRWVHTIKLMKQYKDKIYIICYEDLVKNKERELNALGQWLKVDPKGFDTDIIYDSSIDRYKTKLTVEELEVIMKIAGSTMVQLGYI